MYTECPECQTVFRVGAQQLRAAAGKVRCGRCSTVFNALEHPAGEDGTESLAGLIGASRESAAPAAISAAELGWPAPPEGGQFDNEPEWDAFSDQSLDSLLPSEAGNGSDEEDAADSSRYEAFDELEFGFKAPSPPRKAPSRPPAETAQNGRTAADRPNPFSAVPEPSKPRDAAKPAAQQRREPAVSEDSSAPRPFTATPRRPRTGSEADALPLQLEQRRSRSRAGATLLWSLLVLLLVGAGAAQYGYFHRDTLARYPQLRPYMERLCEVLRCELPARRELAAIELTDHAVQSHPDKDGALLITATLLNGADFSQPYPDVEIVMMDIEQRPVAARRFTPAEYLAGEVDSTGLFPAGRDANLVLEVVDPGSEAVSFEFLFH